MKKGILNAAVYLAKNDSWKSVSVRRIAENIGTSTMAIYSFFGSKEQLFRSLRDTGFEMLLESFQRNINRDANDGDANYTLESIYTMTKLTFSFYFENPELYHLMFGIVELHGVGRLCDYPGKSQLVSRFARSVLEDVFRGSADELFANWWSIIHGHISTGQHLEEAILKERINYAYRLISNLGERK